MEMITGIYDLHPFNAVFASEQLGYYKSSTEYWTHVLNYYHVSPESIFHIGDANSDIIIPKKIEMLTCWINRNNRKWNNLVKPDFEVHSLEQVLRDTELEMTAYMIDIS